MEKTNWKTERIKLKKMIEELDGRIIIAIGVANGAEARQLHHTIYELYDQNAVPDYIGGFFSFILWGFFVAPHAGRERGGGGEGVEFSGGGVP
ncbi:MAG: hypothetical protein H8E81_00055 [Deltaproteobacteria bacterium]|nr:hypothetical protein [Deltaproteobacteria bacterium]